MPPALPRLLEEHLRSARELQRRHAERTSRSPLPTALKAVDRLLPGGLPRGGLVELVGRRSSGRYSIALSVLAAATGAGEAAALVDLDDGLDPQAAQTVGVELERLLWIRPRRLKQALMGTETLLNGGFPLVVLELGHPPLPGGRGSEAAWLRLARAAAAQEAALLVSSPYRISGTAATAVLETRRAGTAWRGSGRSPRLLAALGSHVTLKKLRGQALEKTEGLRLAAPRLARLASLFDPAPRPAASTRFPELRAGACGRRP